MAGAEWEEHKSRSSPVEYAWSVLQNFVSSRNQQNHRRVLCGANKHNNPGGNIEQNKLVPGMPPTPSKVSNAFFYRVDHHNAQSISSVIVRRSAPGDGAAARRIIGVYGAILMFPHCMKS